LKDYRSKLSILSVYDQKNEDTKILKNSNLTNSCIKRKIQNSI